MRLATLLAALLLVTAGCVGNDTDGDGGVPDADDGGSSASTSFATETYEGEVTGATVPMGGGAAQGNNQASFQVPNGARVLYLNVTTEGGELDMQYGPDCQTDPAVSCANNATTSDGSLSVEVTDPTSAAWDAFFFIAEDTAAGQVSWTLDVTVGVVVQG